MHTDSTLGLLNTATIALGHELRRFRRITCSAFSTVDLPKEQAARVRKKSRDQAKHAQRDAMATVNEDPTPITAQTSKPGTKNKKSGKLRILQQIEVLPDTFFAAKKREFNLWTYKLHSLGDYERAIRAHGTTDSFSTQIVIAVSVIHHIISI